MLELGLDEASNDKLQLCRGTFARQASLPLAAAQCRGVRPEVSVLSRLMWCLFSSTSTALPASGSSLVNNCW